MMSAILHKSQAYWRVVEAGANKLKLDYLIWIGMW